MSPSPSRSTPQGTPSSARPSPRPSALRSPSNTQQVAFHETPDSVPTIGDHYQSHFVEQSDYTVNNATQLANETTVVLSNDMFYKPKPSTGECSILIPSPVCQKLLRLMINHHPQKLGRIVAAVIKSLFRMPKLRVRMADLITSRPDLITSHPWEDYLTEQYDLHATRINLPHRYSTWHSRIPREIRHRLTVGNGENAMRVDILEWRSKVQGTVSTAT